MQTVTVRIRTLQIFPDKAQVRNGNLSRKLEGLASSLLRVRQQYQQSNKTRSPTESRANCRPPMPKLREATLGDYEQIAAIQTRNGLSRRTRENWLAFWRDNPIHRQHEGKWPIGWVLEDTENKVVGWIGNLLSTYHFRGSNLLSATPSPWVVDEPYRSYSLTLFNRFTTQKDVDLLMNSTAHTSISRLFGFLKVPVGSWDKSAFWITNYCGFMRMTLSTKAVPLATGLSYPLGAALAFRDGFRIDRQPFSTFTPEIEVCSTFDTRFDDFWEELKRQRGDVLLAERTRETFLWHFRDKLTHGRVWILAASKDSRLIAFAILDEEGNAFGLRRVRLVDFQALPGFEDMIYQFLSRALNRCRSEGIHMLEVTGCWLDRPGLPRIVPPYHRSLPLWVSYYKATNNEFSTALQDPRVWAPSSFDGDASV
jgi:hypothetical protein